MRQASDARRRVLDFYDHHPIHEAHVLAAVRRSRGGPPFTADDLFDFDQDHYGGLAAVAVLARRAGVTADARVLDLCAGLGGPARFLATRHGCRVLAVELNGARAAGAARLSRLVGLHDRVRVVRGDAAALPLGDASVDACVSQEGLLHVPDKAAALSECRRALVAGGRLAFTDWIARPALADGERERLWTWMAAATLQTLDGYRGLCGRAEFRGVEAEDVTDVWRALLRDRHARYRAAREETAVRLGEARYRDYDALLAFLRALVDAGKLGLGRLSATA